MALIQVDYTLGVLEGEAAGVEVVSRDPAAQALMLLGPKAMEARIAKMMKGTGMVLKLYVEKQFDSSGHGLEKLPEKFKPEGGSSAPWADLSPKTVYARQQGYGYYGGGAGVNEHGRFTKDFIGGYNRVEGGVSGIQDDDLNLYGVDPAEAAAAKETAKNASAAGRVKPRIWTGKSMKIAMQSIIATAKDVKIRITEMTIRVNESTRPIFPIDEVSRIVKKIAQLTFDKIDRIYDRETDTFSQAPAVEAAGPFSMHVGQKRALQIGGKKGAAKGEGGVGRPKTGKGQRETAERKLLGKKYKAKGKEPIDVTKAMEYFMHKLERNALEDAEVFKTRMRRKKK